MPVGKNFKKGRSNLKKKSTTGGGAGGVKLSHGKAGGNIKYTKKKPERVLVGANVKRERIRVGPKEEIERKVDLPKDFKESEHLRLEDELANLGSDSDSDDIGSGSGSEEVSGSGSGSGSEEVSGSGSGSGSGSEEVSGSGSGSGKSGKVSKSVNGNKPQISKNKINIKTNKESKMKMKKKKNVRHIRYKKKKGEETDSTSEKEEKSKRVQLLADKMTEKHVQMSIDILKQVDPKQELPKEKLITILTEMQDKSENILFVETVGFLLESLENLEEKLEEVSCFRKNQEKTLKAKRIDGKVFKHQISLDLGSDEEPEPDENDRIFLTGKKIYSGKHKLYVKPDKKQERDIARKIKPKKINPKLMNKYKYLD